MYVQMKGLLKNSRVLILPSLLLVTFMVGFVFSIHVSTTQSGSFSASFTVTKSAFSKAIQVAVSSVPDQVSVNAFSSKKNTKEWNGEVEIGDFSSVYLRSFLQDAGFIAVHSKHELLLFPFHSFW